MERIEMAVGGGPAIAQRRKIPAQPPEPRLAERDTALGINPPVAGPPGKSRFTPTQRRVQLRWIAQPVIERGAGVGYGTTQPIAQFHQRRLLPREEWRQKRAVR